MVSVSDVADVVARALRVDLGEFSGDGWPLESPREPRLEPLSETSIEEIVTRLEGSDTGTPVSLRSPLEHEALLVEQGGIGARGWWLRRRGEPFVLLDEGAGLRYELGPPSPALMCWILLDIQRKSSSQQFRRRIRPLPSSIRQPERDPWDALASMFSSRFSSLRITSNKPLTAEKFGNYTYAALFHFAYNLDIAMNTVSEATELFPERVRRGVRSEPEHLESPRRIYHQDLVQRYIIAVASEDLVSKFLGYYHVAEHHFELLWHQHVVDQVRDKVTAPGFSLRRDQDMLNLAKSVSNLMRERQNETSSFDEKKALVLTLKAFVETERLKATLVAMDPGLLPYYADTKVLFSDGDKVDLRTSDDQALPALARRIYNTRNSVVHAKKGERNRFRPGLDDEALARELPLMRAVAEEILVSTSQLLE